MFIGRKKELASLEKMYHSGRFEFCVIYGRRRVGKTALINHFLSEKKAIYFMGVESNETQNLINLSRRINEYTSGIETESTFSSFQTALEAVFELSKKERTILVIDEYPYVARSSKSLSSTLQMIIDKYKDSSKLMLILCGSSMSYMVDNVLAYKSPLYGRRTAQMKIEPFDFFEAGTYLKNMSDTDKALAYGIVGGTPQYLLQISDNASIEENIKRCFLDPVSFLYEEPVNLIKQEIREPAIYTAVISAIAGGASKMSEISVKVGENTNVCSAYLTNLINLGIIEKETPYGEDRSRRTLYRLEDNMFRFWYRFVLNNISLISRGADELVYKRIEPHLSEYMGSIFEDICKQYLWKLLIEGRCPVEFSTLGRWWGTDPDSRSQTEIDIIGEQDKNTALFGECKWTNEKTDTGVLELLIKRSRLFHYSNAHYYVFSRSGFTDGCITKAAETGNVTLVTYSDIAAEITNVPD